MKPPLPAELKKEERLWTGVYWLCQGLGWGVYSIIGYWMSSRQSGHPWQMQLGYLLFWGYSILLTHLLRRLIERRDWLSLSPLRVLVRIVPAILATSTLQTLLVLAVSLLLTGQLGFMSQLGFVFMLWLNISFGTAIWGAFFLGVAAMLRARWMRQRSLALEAGLNAAKLKTLEAQMSPHFLFNSLNSIRGLILENPSLAQDLVTRLANILRHSLQSASLSTLPLSEELAVVDDYLALESARFEERLRVSRDLAPEALSRPIPTMLVQTLVENAIKHGLSALPEGGEVLLKAWIEQGDLCLLVRNSGHLVPSPEGSTRVGLANLRERLAILHGPAATFTLTDSPPGFVSASVRLPAA